MTLLFAGKSEAAARGGGTKLKAYPPDAARACVGGENKNYKDGSAS